jgi:hypothetical protein
METNSGEGDEKYSALYGTEIIRSIPPGSVYFCGMNPGPFITAALEKTKMEGFPFFVIAQDALSDAGYFNFARKTYGAKLRLPSPEESEQFCNNYYADAKKRTKDRQLELEPGKVFVVGDGDDLKTNHPVVMHLNGLLARMIFDKNPNAQFFFKESFPLDWVFPHLEPHGLILKINREPSAKLSPEIIAQDHDYWTKLFSPMIGDWLNDRTSVSDIAAFGEKIYLRHDFKGFNGDSSFVLDTDSHHMFSNERNAIARLYAWRARQATNADEKRRMIDAADFASRQAWALCPYATGTVVRYVQFLVEGKRLSDAIVVAETASKFRAQLAANQSTVLANQFDQLLSNLKGLSKGNP